MKTRVITSVAALLLFFALLFLPEIFFGQQVGDIVFAAAVAVVILLMLHECYAASKASRAMRVTGFICSAILMSAGIPFVIGYNFHTTAELCAMAAILIIFINMVLVVALHGRWNYREVLSNAFLTMYVTVSMACVMLSKSYFGNGYMMLVFLCAWSSDSFAYLTGRFIGKHKLIPNVSPNKTVEGAIGGVVGAAVVCTVYIFILNKALGLDAPWLAIGALTGVVGSVFGQIGDLVASAIKRDTGVKDFGTFFPGHGGFMDRFDSVMFIAPFVFGILAAILSVA